MKTVADIQAKILEETGLKTSVKRYKSGSMKGYIRVMPMFQNNEYPSFPFEFVRSLKDELINFNSEEKPVFCSVSEICVYQIEGESIKMKTEKKPKRSDSQREWGSKNSQMRLDKAAARYAKKLKKGGCAGYW
jgi:hypothetical protein